MGYTDRMRWIVPVLLLSALPAFGQDEPALPAPGPADEGVDLLQRGMRSILEGFIAEMEPALDEMSRALTEMRPMAEQLLGLIDDIGNYEAPVVLENGDILIRRKPDPPEPLKEGEIEL